MAASSWRGDSGCAADGRNRGMHAGDSRTAKHARALHNPVTLPYRLIAVAAGRRGERLVEEPRLNAHVSPSGFPALVLTRTSGR